MTKYKLLLWGFVDEWGLFLLGTIEGLLLWFWIGATLAQ